MTLTPDLTDLLHRWLPNQRWYPARGKGVSLASVGGFDLTDPAGRIGVRVHLIAIDSGDRIDVVQVPLTYRRPDHVLHGVDPIGTVPAAEAPRPAGGAAAAATDDTSAAGDRVDVYDGVRDPVLVGLYLDLITAGPVSSAAGTVASTDPGTGTGTDGDAVSPRGHRTGRWASTRAVGELPTAKVLSGEQSNTSIIIDDAAAPAIIKLFRVLGAGMNPDVEVGIGLTGADVDAVAATYGWIDGAWQHPEHAGSDDGAGGRLDHGQLAVLSEFMAGSEDAWRTATAAAAAGTDFTGPASALGAATARVHAGLREAFGTRIADADQHEELLRALASRIRWAWAEAADAVGPHEDAIRAAVDALGRGGDAPVLQRIHGDYHLGQVLDSPQRGWILLDFEGEPLRPVAERSLPDTALRDVVGMLRSFDYAGGFAVLNGADPDRTRAWTAAASDAFLDGYRRVSGEPVDTESPLYVGLWLDKALYEVVYEQRNRPDWISVPVDAVHRALHVGTDGSTPAPTKEGSSMIRKSRAPRPGTSRTEPATPAAAEAVAAAAPVAEAADATASAETTANDATGSDAAASTVTASAGTDQSDTGRSADAASAASGVPLDRNRPDLPEGAPDVSPEALAQAANLNVSAGAASTAEPETRPASARPIPVSTDVLDAVAAGRYYNPHGVLGAHLASDGTVTVRTLRHMAASVDVVTSAGTTPMAHEYGGIWTAVLETPEDGHVPDYRLDVTYGDGVSHRVDEPYRFMPTLGELDLHLIGEGRHETLWTVLGAHVREYPSSMGTIHGTSFAVWAPNARSVRVAGDFNGWDAKAHGMRALGSSGVWEIFVPDAAAGATYKFEIQGQDGQWRMKADPMARGTEVPPLTGSRVVDSTYTFGDDEWIARRGQQDPHNGPMSVYEVHLGSWRLGLSYTELAEQLVEYVSWLGFTHVELMPVAEHPFGGSWGYQVTGYFAPTSRFGHPDEFRHLVDALHQAGIGVIMDWVPAHFPKDEFALAKFDGQPLYEHPDPFLGEHPDWGTLIFDFGRREVRNFLVANALYWLEEFHIDGLRVDAVASMLYLDYSRQEGQWRPNRFGGRENLEAIGFLQEANATAYKRVPGIVTIAEESTAFPGVTRPTDHNGLGFGLKWNMGWMHDSLSYISEDPVNRAYHHHKATFSMVYAYTENFLLPISHDEVVHGKGSMLRKMPGDRWQQLANLRAYLAFQWAHPGKQLIFMGTEFGQEAEWNEAHGLDWWLTEAPPHRGVQLLVKQLNEIYAATPALYRWDNDPAGFEWLDANDTARNMLTFTRWDPQGNPVVVVANYAGTPHHDVKLALPWAGTWVEALNTDAEQFGGSGVGNHGRITAVEGSFQGKPASATVQVPPLGVLYLTPATEGDVD
ncbi:1,4-alpha-glucan branching protein GlgB [Tersicoccus sp. Bi-70]|uniref:1,4-alpha-glucan branching protein GlgB n=1 Tax=Tersicoccus sp. Bi-70 TaxID=1897634 RepID=UPI0013010341|nr:1,4-alpha-glucan branching protein GlgB [Tersicoccus sp. Bi-70]